MMLTILPGALFACMHTLMPMVQNGFTAESFVLPLLSVLGGYTVGHCGFYAPQGPMPERKKLRLRSAGP